MVRSLRRIVAGAMVGALALVGSACGGGDEPTNDPTLTNELGIPQASGEDGDAYEPRGSSVGDGNGGPPELDGDLVSAAKAAGCTVQAFTADTPEGGTARDHVEGEPVYDVSIPPLSGQHNGTWADWGFYSLSIPYKFLVHNLEHGGVVVRYGSEVARADVVSLGELWAKRPAYTVFAPDESTGFPAKGVVVGSWQRWMVCKPFTPAKHVAVIERFITTYRGRGPEDVPSVNTGGSERGLPKPLVFDAKTN